MPERSRSWCWRLLEGRENAQPSLRHSPLKGIRSESKGRNDPRCPGTGWEVCALLLLSISVRDLPSLFDLCQR